MSRAGQAQQAGGPFRRSAPRLRRCCSPAPANLERQRGASLTRGHDLCPPGGRSKNFVALRGTTARVPSFPDAPAPRGDPELAPAQSPLAPQSWGLRPSGLKQSGALSSFRAVSILTRSAWISALSFEPGSALAAQQFAPARSLATAGIYERGNRSRRRKGRSESGPFPVHQRPVPKLKPMLGPPP
jgi:hypothetical protein